MYSILPSKVKISVFFPMGLPTIVEDFDKPSEVEAENVEGELKYVELVQVLKT